MLKSDCRKGLRPNNMLYQSCCPGNFVGDIKKVQQHFILNGALEQSLLDDRRCCDKSFMEVPSKS